MIQLRSIPGILIFILILIACSENDEKKYQDGYPNLFADNWIAFEFQGGDIEGNILDPYDLVTALDPNREGYLIVDQLYNCDIRVRAPYSDTAFIVEMGEQLETISTNTYNVKFVSVSGYITTNPVLTDFVYDLATYFYPDLAFTSDYIKDILFIRAGLYDEYKAPVDSLLILGYRKTGFENVDY